MKAGWRCLLVALLPRPFATAGPGMERRLGFAGTRFLLGLATVVALIALAWPQAQLGRAAPYLSGPPEDPLPQLLDGAEQSAATIAAAGPTCTVNTAGGADYTTIQAAIADANCLTIVVAAGAYNERVTISRNVTINGAGPAYTTVNGGNSGTVIAIYNAAVSLSGITVAGGLASNGAGIFNYSGILTVTNVIISGNTSATSGIGSGIYSLNGTLVVSNTTVSNNRGATYGGGIAVSGGAATIASSALSNNSGVVSTGGGDVCH